MTDILQFLDISDNVVNFIWASEESGFRHLYRVTSSLSPSTNGNSDGSPKKSPNSLANGLVDADVHLQDSHLKPRISKKVLYRL